MMFSVYYARKAFAHFGAKHIPLERYIRLTVAEIPETHVFIREIDVESIEHVFQLMQGENWTDIELEKGLPDGVGHTSMSAGDVVLTELGEWFECMAFDGWRKMA